MFSTAENIGALTSIRVVTILGALSGFVALIAAILPILGQTGKRLPVIALGASAAACKFGSTTYSGYECCEVPGSRGKLGSD